MVGRCCLVGGGGDFILRTGGNEQLPHNICKKSISKCAEVVLEVFFVREYVVLNCICLLRVSLFCALLPMRNACFGRRRRSKTKTTKREKKENVILKHGMYANSCQ